MVLPPDEQHGLGGGVRALAALTISRKRYLRHAFLERRIGALALLYFAKIWGYMYAR